MQQGGERRYGGAVGRDTRESWGDRRTLLGRQKFIETRVTRVRLVPTRVAVRHAEGQLQAQQRQRHGQRLDEEAVAQAGAEPVQQPACGRTGGTH